MVTEKLKNYSLVNRVEGLIFPPSDFVLNVIIGFLTFILLTNGLGVSDVYHITLCILLSLGIYESLKANDKITILVDTLLIVLSFTTYSFTFLYGYLLLFSCANKCFKSSVTAILVVGVMHCLGCMVLPYWCIGIVVGVSMILGIRIYAFKYSKLVLLFLSILVGSFELFSFIDKPVCSVEKYPNAQESYKPGIIFSNITHCSFEKSSDENEIIRSYGVGSELDYEKKGVAILEHSPIKKNKIVKGGKWQQPVSWHDNVPSGNQYLVEAVMNDGGLWSNIGTNLTDSAKTLLAFRKLSSDFQPLIVEHDGVVYLHDSDYSSGRLSLYQESLLKEIFSPVCVDRPLYIRCLNFLFLILSILLLIVQKNDKIKIVSAVVLVALIFYPSLIKKEENVRLVGEIKDSHENNRFDGVIKTMIDQGFYVKVGNENCKILVVQEEHNTKLEGETLVILEPDAEIVVDGISYKAGSIPSPTVCIDSITINDSRTIFSKGTELPPLVKIFSGSDSSSVTIIATGSPALLEWKNLVK